MSAISLNATPLKTKRPNGKRSWVTWVPFVALIIAGGLAAAGVSLTSGAQATTQTNNVTVTATLGPELHMNLCAAGNGLDATITGGALTLGSPVAVGGTCTITFGSNNDALFSNIKVENLNAGAMFCAYPATVRTCGSGQLDDESATWGAGAASGTVINSMTQTSTTVGKFGFIVTAAPTGCTLNANITPGLFSAPAVTKVYGVPLTGSAPQALCVQTTTGTDGSLITQWVAKAATNQPANAGADVYKGIAKYTATTL